MRLPLFRAAFKDQRTSMWIYCAVMLFYGMLIMLAFLSIEDTLSDPFSTAEGIELTQVGTDDDGNGLFTLEWETRTGTAVHIAIGMGKDLDPSDLDLADIGLNLTPEDIERMEDDPLISDLINRTMDPADFHDPIPIPGVDAEIVYFGEENFVNFTNSGTSVLFVVGLIPNDWNLSNATFLGPVSSMNLTVASDFDRYLEDNPFVEGFFGGDIASFTEIDGFIALEYFSMWPLMLLIFIAIKTGGTVSKHVDDQSMDILLATGYSRVRFLNEKMLVVLVNLALVVLSAWIGVVIGTLMIGEAVPTVGIALAFLGSVPMAVGMIGLSLLLSVLIDENSKTTGAIMGLTIFMFMIQIVANVANWREGLGYLSLFTYYDVNQLLLDHVADPVNAVVPTLIGIVAIAIAYYLFQKKDIHA